jgi:hypothetical protein
MRRHEIYINNLFADWNNIGHNVHIDAMHSNENTGTNYRLEQKQ